MLSPDVSVTLHELETTWSIGDVLDALTAMAAFEEMKSEAMKAAMATDNPSSGGF